MNPWNGLLESLHSAVIDEVTDILRSGEGGEKPVLGMPTRIGTWKMPDPAPHKLLVATVAFGAGSGIGLVAFGADTARVLKTDLRAFYDAVLARAAMELERRGLRPTI